MNSKDHLEKVIGTMSILAESDNVTAETRVEAAQTAIDGYKLLMLDSMNGDLGEAAAKLLEHLKSRDDDSEDWKS